MRRMALGIHLFSLYNMYGNTAKARLEADMFKTSNFYSEDMALALILWLCTLALVGLLVVPFFGMKAGLTIAILLLVGILLLCWGVCGWKIIKKDNHP